MYIRRINDFDVTTLQKALNFLVTWAERWQMSLSLDKCCVLYLRLAERAVLFSRGGVNLRSVSSCRDLGVTITSDLSPSVHMHGIVAKAQHCALTQCCAAFGLGFPTSFLRRHVGAPIG